MDNHKQPLISAIVAMAENRVIGKNNQLPWHLPADLKHFKNLTTGHPILMGRKTYESIGRPLPNRTNIIMTRQNNLYVPGCFVVHSLQDAIALAHKENANEIFIIGGANIYEQLLPAVQRIYLTIVHHVVEGDVYFPELDMTKWEEVSREAFTADEQNAYGYSFITLERNTL